MLWGLFVLLACQLAGEAISYLSGLPLPGPVIGMLILVALLCLRDRKPSTAERKVKESVGNTADLLLKNLSLLFIPAGVGVIQRYDLVAKHGIGLALTVVLSTVLTLAVTATVFTLAARSTVGGTRGASDD